MPAYCRDHPDTLAVGCWDGTLSRYALSGEALGPDTQLGFDPCCVSYMPSGKFCLMLLSFVVTVVMLLADSTAEFLTACVFAVAGPTLPSA